jgi:hypothetical protein
MRYFILFIVVLCTTPFVSGQNSLGFVLNSYRNWGNGITYQEVSNEHGDFHNLDSASTVSYPFPSQTLITPISVGVHYRMCSPDTTSWKSKWSRQFGLSLGFSEMRPLMGYNPQRIELNAPYTIIYNGDTTIYAVDSVSDELYTIQWNRGLQVQAYFGFHRVFQSQKRWFSEIGTDIRFGYSQYRETYNYERNDALVFDSTDNVTLLPPSKTLITETWNTQSVFLAQVDLRVAFWIPLDRDDNAWWLQLSAAAGFGGMHTYNDWHSRVSFIPSFGLHYLFTERKTTGQP